jgi:putative solute:sodium symporter small subunit|tara:strand:- start:593 stop:883 length:291 start_codon:yes stop_codon:yes gene_type:complete
MSNTSANSYWKANIKLVLSLLSVWFLVSFVCGILLVDVLDNIRFGGFKLGFWIAQQGSILTFIALILIYIRTMDKLDSQYKQSSSNDAQDTEGEAK